MLFSLQNVKTFKDVKGCDDAKKELEEVVEYLRNPTKFTRLGGKLPKVICSVSICRVHFQSAMYLAYGARYMFAGSRHLFIEC
jgi:hypothetical protein